jgi:acyl-CoA synthetase (AMP-forming)/AMP-acid ligase II
VDLPLLPIFALFNPALGMTSVIPEVDPRHPAKADPAKIVQAILQEKVTNSSGSPTLWSKVSDHCSQRKITLPSLRRVLCAGAPVPADLWESSRPMLPNGILHSPYGATEALPVSTVSAGEIEKGSVGGACVGRAVEGVEVRIIPITDDVVPSLSPAGSLPAGSVGEIIVRGPVVTREYDALPAATAAAKIADPPPPGGFWHRMGDCGKLDSSGRIWFLGRKAERVVTGEVTHFTEPCEQVFRQHPRARRCALIGFGSEPALVVEASTRGKSDTDTLVAGLRALGLRYSHTAAVRTFFFRAQLPVDVRHNAKIHRLSLGRWAASARPYRVD